MKVIIMIIIVIAMEALDFSTASQVGPLFVRKLNVGAANLLDTLLLVLGENLGRKLCPQAAFWST